MDFSSWKYCTQTTFFIVTWCNFYIPDQSELQIYDATFLFVYLEVLSVVLPICYLSKEVCEFEILQLQSMSHWMQIWWTVSINKQNRTNSSMLFFCYLHSNNSRFTLINRFYLNMHLDNCLSNDCCTEKCPKWNKKVSACYSGQVKQWIWDLK